MPAVRALSVAYIELIRGVPLITVLFMASVMLPLFLPEGTTIDKLLRAQVGFILFYAAYLAEVVRGGLQAIPQGQGEAADALGLSYWRKMGFIILPQALKIAIPPLVNIFIAGFKDTTLVTIIGLFDLISTASNAITDPNWRGFYVEAYVFIAAIYFVFCFFMSRYSQSLERQFSRGER
jgi:general L-amino acid transport system permease protein